MAAARTLLILALAASTPVPSAAQESAERTAEQYFGAVSAGEWARVAEMMHPAALRAFRAMVQQARTVAGSRAELDSVFGVRGAEMDSLSDAALFARILGRQMTRDEEVRVAMRDAAYRVAGVAVSGDTTHVDYVLRMKVDGRSVETPSRISLLRDGRVWKVLLGTERREEMKGADDPLER